MKLVIVLVLCLMGVRIAKSQYNLALGKATNQSLTADPKYSSLAVDGNTETCSQTLSDFTLHFWYVDLGLEYPIGEVIIYVPLYNLNASVYVVPERPTSSNISNQYLCGQISTPTDNESPIILQCGGLQGEFVVIQRLTDFNVLLFCEVEVYEEDNLARGKPTYQSTTFGYGHSRLAVDGDTNSHYTEGRSCTHTSDGGEQYWYVDLEAEYPIGEVVIYNRMDCCSGRLRNTEVLVVPERPTSWNIENQYLCDSITLSNEDESPIILQCGGLQGQFVVIRKTDNEPLTLCEVKVYEEDNLARGKPTNQSSIAYDGVSSLAVDGDTNSHYIEGRSCTHTSDGGEQYWYVDLEAEYWIREVVIYNRMDCCSGRLRNTEVFVVPERPTSWNIENQYLCDSITLSNEEESPIILQCGGLQGQFVVIRKTDNEPLTLCEVEVYEEMYGQCGNPAVVPYTGNTRIVGGQEVRQGSWPWMVQLFNRELHRSNCGGSLINNRWILTAARCLDSSSDPSNYAILVGSHHQRDVDAGEMRIDVDLIIQHEDFNSSIYYIPDNNIALMRLAKSLVFNDTVSAVCLPEEGVSAGTLCYVTGWGDTNGEINGRFRLKQAYIPVISNAQCNQSDYYDGRITDNMLCAGYDEGGHGFCQEDTGGPLVCQGADGYWAVQGIVSWRKLPCAEPNQPGVYARVTRYTAWIIDQLALHP